MREQTLKAVEVTRVMKKQQGKRFLSKK